jgi:hypothetical protein
MAGHRACYRASNRQEIVIMDIITSKPILESPTQVRALARVLFGDMNYRRLLSRASLAFVPVLWLVLAPTVYAEETVPASGTEATTLSPVSTRAADGNTFIGFTLAESWQGTFAGTRVGSGSVVIHPDGSIDAQSSGIFTGTIAGRSGTAVMRFHVSGTFAAATVIFTVTDGTGGLAGVHAEGTETVSATAPLSVAGTYSAVVHFSAP